MSNTIKYGTEIENNTLKKGNFVIGINDVDYGPTSETGYHNTITPPEGGYVVYKNRGDNQRSIYVAQNDEELVTLKDDFGATGSTANDVLVWATQQDDVLILNNPLDNIVTDGLVLYLDAGFTCSYPKASTTWYDLSGNGNDGSLVNGPTFDGGNEGGLVFDGTNDYVSFNNTSTFNFGTSNITFSFFIKINENSFNRWNSLYTKRSVGSDDIRTYVRPESSQDGYLRLYIAYSTSMDVRTDIINSVGYYLISFTLDRDSNWSIYINGQYVGQYSQSPFTDRSNANINGSGIPVFGRQLTSEYTRLNLYTFKIYNKALTPQEILQNYNAQKSRFGL